MYAYDEHGNRNYSVEIDYTTQDLDLTPIHNKSLGTYCNDVFSGEGYLENAEEFTTIAGHVATKTEYDEQDRLIGKASEYDTYGKPHKYNGYNLEWSGSKLTQYGDNTYEYDCRGYRTKKIADENNVKYLYDERGKLVREQRNWQGDNAVITYMYEGNDVIGFTFNRTITSADGKEYSEAYPYYYVKDLLGNIRYIIDKNSTVVVSYNYDAWGNTQVTLNNNYTIAHGKTVLTASDIHSFNGFTYRGYYYDTETGLYYLINRYYDPTTGRFISADDTQYLDFGTFYGHNRYCYCLNNPVMGYDPEGHFWFKIIATAVGTIVGAVSGAVVEIVKQSQNGKSLDWKAIGKSALVGGVNGGVSAIIIATTGSIAAGSYVGAAAASLVEEVFEYATGEKELTSENILNSVVEIMVDTVIDGTINYVGNKLAASLPDIRTNSGWFEPQSVESFFTMSYGQKTTQQFIISGIIGTSVSIIKEGLYERISGTIVNMQEVFG